MEKICLHLFICLSSVTDWLIGISSDLCFQITRMLALEHLPYVVCCRVCWPGDPSSLDPERAPRVISYECCWKRIKYTNFLLICYINLNFEQLAGTNRRTEVACYSSFPWQNWLAQLAAKLRRQVVRCGDDNSVRTAFARDSAYVHTLRSAFSNYVQRPPVWLQSVDGPF